MSEPRTITYTDELLSDNSVHRVYSNGTQEWRQLSEGKVTWRDSTGRTGTDEALGEGVIKRTYDGGRTVYARDQGYGRTVWGDGALVTINKTSFGGQVGAILASVGAGALIGSAVMPPLSMTPEEEEELRRRAGSSGQHAEWETEIEPFEADQAGDSFFDSMMLDIDFGDDDSFG